MNIANLQAMLPHFAAERDWQPFHTPKNLTTALMVEAAELAEVSQWMKPEESRNAHTDTAFIVTVRQKQRLDQRCPKFAGLPGAPEQLATLTCENRQHRPA
jgi:NTP pyrophosphatase (non-canonical NTP hydrolase)